MAKVKASMERNVMEPRMPIGLVMGFLCEMRKLEKHMELMVIGSHHWWASC